MSSGSGIMKRYMDEKGYGFVARVDGPDLFFHITNVRSSRLYEGEAVRFDIEKDEDGRDVAVNLRRESGSLHTGDVLDWHVDPGTHRAEGHILPQGGGEPLAFTKHDLARSPNGKWMPSPRPWLAAQYQIVVSADGVTHPVDITMDRRYPLQRFAYLGAEDEFIE